MDGVYNGTSIYKRMRTGGTAILGNPRMIYKVDGMRIWGSSDRMCFFLQ